MMKTVVGPMRVAMWNDLVKGSKNRKTGECEYYLAMFYLSQTAVEVQLNLETHKKWLQAFPYAFFNCFSLNLLRGSILADVLTICNCPGN